MRRVCLLALISVPAICAIEENDVEFARPGGFSLTLDAKTPDGKGPFPAAIIVHGGGFSRGNKRTFVTPLFDLLSNAGFAWFTINYRMAPDYQLPAAADDVESAVRWVKAHAPKYRVDPKRLALIGESAGGFLVAYAGATFKDDARVAAVVDFYGPNDLVRQTEKRRGEPDDPSKPHTPGLLEFMGFKSWQDAGLVEKLRAVSPTTLVSKNMPPFLFIHGNADELVSYEQSPEMCEAMRKAGVKCEVITVKGGRHGMLNWESTAAMAHWKPEMVTWLKGTLGR
ncbi:MAG: alpha/beta hydrolase [Acidobacteriia bacterium]|nr:alpha/beta hydrolase [Terriglobia bacterium]